MQRHEILALEQELMGGGLTKRVAQRSVEELYDHYEDLVAYHQTAGLSRAVAEQRAAEDLGSSRSIREIYCHQAELSAWWRARQQWMASSNAQLQFVGQMFDANARFATSASRLLTGFFLSSVVTAGMLLALQFSLTLQ